MIIFDKRLAAAAALTVASAAYGQAQPQPQTQPQALPGLDQFTLPSSRPTPTPTSSPTPEPTIAPQPSPTSAEPVLPARVVPAVRAPRTARATPTPVPTPLVTPTPTRTVAAPVAPIVTPTPTPTPTSTPTPTPTPTSSDQPLVPDRTVANDRGLLGLDTETLVALGVLVLALLGGLGWWWRRRRSVAVAEPRDDRSEEIFVLEPAATLETPAVLVPAPAPAPKPVAPVPAPPGPRATLELELIPNRAGTDGVGALIEYLIVVRNTGKAPATGIRLDVRLLTVGARQDAAIASLFSTPIVNPITQPFDLPPGGKVEFGGSATHSRETLEVMKVGGKALFVPVLAVNVRYDWSGGQGQTAQSYVVGIARGAEEKLQPFRLDTAPRLHESVSALDYTVAAVS